MARRSPPIIACDVLAKGAMDRAAVDPRVVVQRALQRNASALILAHNHPSGVAVPSADDVALTARLREALELFGVLLLEHFVVGDGAMVVAHINAVGSNRSRRAAVPPAGS